MEDEERWWDVGDPEEYTSDQWDAQNMYEYLRFKTGQGVKTLPELDFGSPHSCLAPEIEWAYQNDDALALLEPRLVDFDITMTDAMQILIESRKIAEAIDKEIAEDELFGSENG